ncbi:MAG: hypothetical protein IT181_13185 [Acidobacteria bacterium]|nr:hypothetical protein [Acidobacteriota bacterium]
MQLPGYSRAVAVTPHDSTNIAFDGTIKALQVGGAGTVAAVMASGLVSFTCVAGQILPIRCTRVNATGTSATVIVALGD